MSKKLFVVLVMMVVLTGCGSSSSSNSSGNMPAGAVPPQATPEAFQQQALILLSQGQLPAAVETLQKATELFPEDTNTYFTLAQVYMKIGSFDNAIVVCQQALEKTPDNGHIYLLMAGCYDLKNEPQKAIDLVKMSMVIFQKQKDTKSLEAAAVVLQKLTERSSEEIKGLKKVTK
jgi:Flp pilus assembly protein TadD